MISALAGDFDEQIAIVDDELQLSEMAAVGSAGRVTKIELGAAGLAIEAKVHGVAAAKIAEQMYCGVSCVLARNANGHLEVRRASLVDHPDALVAKRSALAPSWATLHIGKGLQVQFMKATEAVFGAKAAKAGAPDRRIVIGEPLATDRRPPDVQKRAEIAARDQQAIDMIKTALRRPIGGRKPAGRGQASDADFLKWLSRRAG